MREFATPDERAPAANPVVPRVTPDRRPLEVRAKELIGLPEEEPTSKEELPSLATITRNMLKVAGDLPLRSSSFTPHQLGPHSVTPVPPVVPQPARPAHCGEIALLATVDDPVDKKSIFSPEEFDKDQKFNILRRTGELRRRPKTGSGVCPAIPEAAPTPILTSPPKFLENFTIPKILPPTPSDPVDPCSSPAALVGKVAEFKDHNYARPSAVAGVDSSPDPPTMPATALQTNLKCPICTNIFVGVPHFTQHYIVCKADQARLGADRFFIFYLYALHCSSAAIICSRVKCVYRSAGPPLKVQQEVMGGAGGSLTIVLPHLELKAPRRCGRCDTCLSKCLTNPCHNCRNPRLRRGCSYRDPCKKNNLLSI